ncbi:glycosyltransferase [candidate division KSB1 bacterium]|nr:glycosyltransferase [candidate division KSB1 bacterium]
MKKIIDYRTIVGDKVISDIYQKAGALRKKRIININSTYAGGGVAEILGSLVPLMNDVGVQADWRIIRGTPDLFNITKKFHNALQGDNINLSRIKKELYLQANESFSQYAYIDQDCVIVHDPQPLPLIQYYCKQQPWVWRCHIDLSRPNNELWDFLKNYILQYDKIILSSKDYVRADIPIDQVLFQPVIDPLTAKNKHLKDVDVHKYLKKFKIPTDKPLIVQISRFDKWKDPIGVIEVFKKVKKKIDCRLVYCGGMAGDDPEGIIIYEQVKKRANNAISSGDVLLITHENNILVNILQRVAAVILQKSLREGFGLTITEALWKGKPVIASNVGGIPLQIKDNETGLLADPKDYDYIADRIIEIIKNPEPYEKMGKVGREYVREHFLVTRLIEDYFDLAAKMVH